MKKMLFIVLTAGVLMLSGCGKTKSQTIDHINIENANDLHDTTFGLLKKISSNLWYDSMTRIVYFWNGQLYPGYGLSSTTPSPYYAPNGKPYRYNPETNTFEEIE